MAFFSCFYCFIFIVIFILLIETNQNSDQLFSEQTIDETIDETIDVSHEKSKYLSDNNINFDKKWYKFKSLIESAKQNFKPFEENKSEVICFPFLQLLSEDLKHWNKSGITRDVIEEAIRQKRGIHYQIINHLLYREKECLFPSRCDGVQHFILKAIKDLPDMDLIINVRDYPQTHNNWKQLPVLSFSKDKNQYRDILYPAWTFWCGGPAIDRYPMGIGRWDVMRQTITKNSVDWNNKSSVAFFRGSRTSAERDPLIVLSRAKPELIEAKYTANQAWKSIADTLGEEPAPTLSFEDHCKYKYLFNMRGVSASFRYKHLFLCKSLVLNVDSDWIEFFYPPLKPWIHFIPINNNFNDVEEILSFLRENDEIAQNIAENGFEFIWKYLTLDSVQCFWNHLLNNYSKLLKYKPKLNPNLIQIKK